MNEREPRGARARGWEIGRENRGSNELKKKPKSKGTSGAREWNLNPRAKRRS